MKTELTSTQSKWLRAHIAYNKTYLAHTIPDLPTEEKLIELEKCQEHEFNVSCLFAGTCINSTSKLCIYRSNK